MPGQAHALTFSCYRQRPFLLEERFCNFLAGAIDSARAAHAFDVWAYVFMPDHVHLVIYPRRNDHSISRILQAIKQPVSRKAIAFLREHRPADLERMATGHRRQPYQFWQRGGGYDRNITRIDTLIETIQYIHRNPVRRGLVETADQWRYSSAAQWHGTNAGPLAIDKEVFPDLLNPSPSWRLTLPTLAREPSHPYPGPDLPRRKTGILLDGWAGDLYAAYKTKHKY